MSEFLTSTVSGFTAMSHWEYIAVALSMAYLLLAIRESLWCWPAAFFSTAIYTLLFWNGALLMESALNVYYLLMAIYGWTIWRFKGSKNNTTASIQSWSALRHCNIILATSIASIAFGFIMKNYTHADFAYLDSFTTCFAIVSTYLVAQKVLENWLYWIVIDAASMYLYFEKGYYPTLVLFIFYTVMAAWGFKTWHQQYQQNSIETDCAPA
ncbi:nicotinamide riboside transporter PnuC [Pseudoalteromonas tunicata]|jgi:nicotinamide mononucleotide transporter|uniref:Nicotinamide riboside transporter PnuC n=1 Tax=Pseudoalteromonas tunicata D2 TaxID=87626 RepID=A4C8K2_9GAMM|nr:nicotinamide riboside transporter PnuC [Pseudoalteromonas tunicata]ATC93421.1 nicotinamide mononucleotide transporter [Pseudoalteromonas tunicata]AXT32463.1 nicotinamide riboside transporter PnuC [Pseudoalteromonas tunicata]EAR28917.1 putative transporter protein [Pseudoalteromonas tunicata D2]